MFTVLEKHLAPCMSCEALCPKMHCLVSAAAVVDASMGMHVITICWTLCMFSFYSRKGDSSEGSSTNLQWKVSATSTLSYVHTWLQTHFAADTLGYRHTLLQTHVTWKTSGTMPPVYLRVTHLVTDAHCYRHTWSQTHFTTDTRSLEDIWHHASSVSQSDTIGNRHTWLQTRFATDTLC